MSAAAQVDYDSLAQKHGAAPASIDYDALAKKHGASPQQDSQKATPRVERPFVDSFSRSIGIDPGEDATKLGFTDIASQLGGNLLSAAKKSYAQSNAAAGEPITGALMTPLHMAASGIEGLASGFEDAGKQAWHGDLKKAAGTALGTAAQLGLGMEAPELGDKVAAAREGIAAKMYTPEGKLTPGASTLGKVTGGAAGTGLGEMVGHPYAGGILGYKTGPYLLSQLFPEPEDAATARDTALQQATDAKNLKAARAEALAQGRNAPGPWRPGLKPKGDPIQTSPFGDSTLGDSQDLISRTKKIVKPGEMPTTDDLKRAGDLTQVPLKRLQDLAKFGDELAKNEINRRLRNK